MNIEKDEKSVNEGLTDLERLNGFVGEKAKTYRRKWRIHESSDFHLSETASFNFTWNWASFFFSTSWMGYRKMYTEVLIFSLLSLLLDFFNTGTTSIVINIIYWFGIGIIGNYLYLRKAKRVINSVKKLGLKPLEELETLRKKGGSSIGGIFISIGISFTIYLLVELLK